MASHEELVALFARNLHVSNNPYVTQAPAPEPEPTPAPAEQPIIYSISQHYNHSAHVVVQQPARPASEPLQTDQSTAEIILARHGVNIASLFPSQLELFKTAAPEQQMRLVELWGICPPDYGGHALVNDIGTWPTTSFQQEEAMAKLRYERQMLEERMAQTGGDQSMDSDTMSDSSISGPLTPVQRIDSRWNNNGPGVEPYMASGYEALAAKEYEQSATPALDVYSHFGTALGGHGYTQSTDPAYKTVEDIHRYSNVGSDWKMHMENQYGAFQQQGFSAGGNNGEDEEML